MKKELVSFYNALHENLELSDVTDQIKRFLEGDENGEYSLIIGSDSHERSENGKKIADIVTALVVYKKHHGGRYFWTRQKDVVVYSLRDKINKEALSSLEIAIGFVPKLNEALNGKKLNYHLEIHIDVGEHGQTKEMIKEVVGMITGNGFVAKTKPEAYGASCVADRHT